MPLFSIIVPVYNVEKFLSICIDSILVQTFNDYELILVDDGSMDNCPMICDHYSLRYNFIKVIHQNNEGLVSARKTGLRASCGMYVLNIDSDDIISSNLLNTLAETIRNNEFPDVIAFNYQNINETGEYASVVENNIPEGYYKKNKKDIIVENYLYNINLPNYFNTGSIIYSIWSKCIKRNLLVRHQYSVPNSIRNGEDVAVISPVICDAESIYILKFVGYYYRLRNSSMVHTFNPNEMDNYLILFKFLESLKLNLPKRNVIGYCFREVVLQYSRAAKNTSYLEFKNYVEKTYDVLICEIINKYKPLHLNIKSKLIVLIVKKKLWHLFWRIYH